MSARLCALVPLLLTASVAVAQRPSVPEPGHIETVGATRINGVPRECMYGGGLGSCDWAARADVRFRTGARGAIVRVIRLEYSQDFRTRPRVWTTIPVTQLQVRGRAPVRGDTQLHLRARADLEVGVLHARRRFGDGIDYRIVLEVDGARVTVRASDHLIVERPLD